MSSQGEKKSVRKYTEQKGDTIWTVTETTITTADGRTTTSVEKTTKTKGQAGGNFDDMRDDFSQRFKDMQMSSGAGSHPSKSSSSGPARGPAPASSGAGGGGAASVPLDEFRQQCLKAHNDRRDKHKVPALKLSTELNNYAQKWAENLMKNNAFQHSSCTLDDGTRLGENIATKMSTSGADYTGEEVTEQWYSEIKKHDFDKERNNGTGHFTQVVWKTSQELGIGKAKGSGGKVVIVGSYRPAGNMIGSFKQNVPPPK